MFCQYDTLLHELNRENPRCYKNFLRVDADLFQEFMRRVGPQITKKTTNMISYGLIRSLTVLYDR